MLLAQEKLARADNAISEKIAKIEAELPNIRPAVVRSNTADGKEAVFFNIWAQLMDNIRILETYAGDETEVTHYKRIRTCAPIIRTCAPIKQSGTRILCPKRCAASSEQHRLVAESL